MTLRTASSMDFSQTDLPLLELDGGPADFDYGVFFPDEDTEYLAEDSSNSTSTNNFTDVSAQTIAAQGQLTLSSNNTGLGRSTGSPPKQRLERRGHTKSRRGCFNCKRRRIKCQENRPACDHCTKSGLKCEYPTAPQVVHQPSHLVPIFSLQDMRFFQHFLLHCYPHHPLNNETIWTHEVPCLSQNYDYLMHAILGLAASELMQGDSSLATAALSHRLKAIKAIKKSLNDVPKTRTFEEGNALMATCFALTFQSVIMDDGMAEFMTFIRGVLIVAVQMYMKGAKIMFSNFIGEDAMVLLKPLLEKLPPINKNWTDSAVAAIQALEPLCVEPLQKTYQQMLLGITTKLYNDTVGAFQGISNHYGWWMQLPHDDFQKVIDPNSQVFTLLASHWIALKQIMASITEVQEQVARQSEGDRYEDRGIDLGIVRWLKYLNRRVDLEYQPYNQWPMWVEAQLDGNIQCFGKRV